jgi:hypothetical protein
MPQSVATLIDVRGKSLMLTHSLCAGGTGQIITKLKNNEIDVAMSVPQLVSLLLGPVSNRHRQRTHRSAYFRHRQWLNLVQACRQLRLLAFELVSTLSTE